MKGFVATLVVLFYLALLIGQIVGAAYFASIINHEVQPYFEEHSMEGEVSNAKQALGYLVAMAVLAALTFINKLYNFAILLTCGPSETSKKDDGSCTKFLTNLVELAAIITMLVFACLTTVHAWGWWRYFADQGLEHLATNCHGIAAMLITALALSVCFGVAMPVVTCRRTHYLGEENRV